jgi:hypothetical protein
MNELPTKLNISQLSRNYRLVCVVAAKLPDTGAIGLYCSWSKFHVIFTDLFLSKGILAKLNPGCNKICTLYIFTSNIFGARIQ